MMRRLALGHCLGALLSALGFLRFVDLGRTCCAPTFGAAAMCVGAAVIGTLTVQHLAAGAKIARRGRRALHGPFPARSRFGGVNFGSSAARERWPFKILVAGVGLGGIRVAWRRRGARGWRLWR